MTAQLPAVVGELVACPFCGAPAESTKLNFGSLFRIGCRKCSFHLQGKWSKVSALWNRRATLSALTAEAGKGEVTDAMVLAASRVVAERAGEDYDRIGEFAQQIISETQRAALEAALSTATPAGEWLSVSDELPPRAGWYIGLNYGAIEPLRWDGNNWHHTRVTRDLAMPSHWRTFDSVTRPLAASPRGASESGHG